MAKENVTIEELARMIARGFGEVKDEIGRVDGKVDSLRNEFSEFRKQNEREHLELRLRQDNVAHRFELKELEERVIRIEKKAKLA
jgi:hypothetical protein